MRPVVTWFALAAGIALSIATSGCAKKPPADRPVTVEDILPAGTPVCFPKQQRVEPVPMNSPHPSTTQTAATAPSALAHWCQLCAAAAQRAAEVDRSSTDFPQADEDLLSDLPPRAGGR